MPCTRRSQNNGHHWYASSCASYSFIDSVLQEEVLLVGGLVRSEEPWENMRAALAKAPALKFVLLPHFELWPCLDTLALFANPSIEIVRCRVDLGYAEIRMNELNIQSGLASCALCMKW